MKRLFRARGRPEWPEQLACGEPRLCVCSPAPVQLTFPIKAPLVAIKAQNAKRGSLKLDWQSRVNLRTAYNADTAFQKPPVYTMTKQYGVI
ncbi:uncharacterized [Tachysurus ichikawai]